MNHKLLFGTLATIILLLGIAGIATDKALNYRNLYLYHPQVKVQTHTSVITHYAQLGNGAAYTCVPQKLTPDGVGMVCTSPDKQTIISCTTTLEGAGEYFC